MSDKNFTLHASCVAVEGKGVLIKGSSGSGKSALALQLIALGAVLVADDRTLIEARGGVLYASPPTAIAGLIEARFVGILQQPYKPQAELALVVDLMKLEQTRLPPQRSIDVLDITLPCLHKVDAPYFPAAIHAYMTGSRSESP